jgi:hypothetical protein
MHQWMHKSWTPLFKFQQNDQNIIARTTAHATHKWDQLENYALQIKLTLKFTLVKMGFQIACSFGHSHMGCGVHASQCDDQAKKGQWSCWFNSS